MVSLEPNTPSVHFDVAAHFSKHMLQLNLTSCTRANFYASSRVAMYLKFVDHESMMPHGSFWFPGDAHLWASFSGLNIHASLTSTWPCLALGIHILVSVRVWKILMGWDHKIPLNNASQGLLTLSTISPCYTFASSCTDMCTTVYFSIHFTICGHSSRFSFFFFLEKSC